MLCLFLVLCTVIFLSLCLPPSFSRQSWQGLSHWPTVQCSSRASFPLITPPSVCLFHLLWPVTTSHKRLLFAFVSCLWPGVDRIQTELLYRCSERIKWELLSHLSGHLYHLSKHIFVLWRWGVTHRMSGSWHDYPHIWRKTYSIAICLVDMLTDRTIVNACCFGF